VVSVATPSSPVRLLTEVLSISVQPVAACAGVAATRASAVAVAVSTALAAA
jgi:hypothetical protein